MQNINNYRDQNENDRVGNMLFQLWNGGAPPRQPTGILKLGPPRTVIFLFGTEKNEFCFLYLGVQNFSSFQS